MNEVLSELQAMVPGFRWSTARRAEERARHHLKEPGVVLLFGGGGVAEEPQVVEVGLRRGRRQHEHALRHAGAGGDVHHLLRDLGLHR